MTGAQLTRELWYTKLLLGSIDKSVCVHLPHNALPTFTPCSTTKGTRDKSPPGVPAQDTSSPSSRTSNVTSRITCSNQPIPNKATNGLEASILVNTNPRPSQVLRIMLRLNSSSLTNSRNTSKLSPKVPNRNTSKLSPKVHSLVHTPSKGGNSLRQGVQPGGPYRFRNISSPRVGKPVDSTTIVWYRGRGQGGSRRRV